jgi:hypothetical protein
MDVLVGVDADDDSTPQSCFAHPWSAAFHANGQVATLAGRVDGTVTRPAAIRLL